MLDPADAGSSTAAAWPIGDGEMARRVRAFDWAMTPLGPIETWPTSLRTVVDLTLGSPVATILLWGPADTQIFNDHWRELMDGGHPAALGQPTHECFPEIARATAPVHERVRRGEAVVLHDELLPIRRCNEVRDAWWDVHYTPVRDEAGVVAGVFCTAIETTEKVLAARERAEAAAAREYSEARLEVETAALARLNVVSLRLWQTNDLRAGLEEMLTATIELLGADRGNIQILDPDRGLLAIAAQRGFDQEFLEFFREVSVEDKSACGRALYSGERIIIEDVEADADFAPYRAVARNAKYRSVQSTPLFARNGAPLGMLSTHWRAPHRPTEQDLRRLDLYTRQAAEFIERCQTMQALHESEENYRNLLEVVDEGYFLAEVVFDENGRAIDICYLDANPAAVRLAGRDFVGRSMRELDAGYEQYWLDIYGRVAQTGEPVRAEHFAEPLGRWFEFFAYKVGGPESRQVAALFQDVTKRKQAEILLRESEARQAFLLRFSDALRAEPDADLAEDRAVRMLADQLGLDLCHTASWNLAEDRADLGRQFRRGDAPPIPQTLCFSDFPEAFRQTLDRTLVFDDIAHAPELSELDRRSLAALGVGALIAVPLRRGHMNVIWSLTAIASQPRHWSAGEVALVEEAAERTWAARERARGEQALREGARRKDEFIATLAHELRNPLAPIRNAAYVLKRKCPAGSSDAPLIDMIQRQTDHLVRLVDDLLEISRISRGKVELKRQEIAVGDFLRDALESCRLLIDKKSHRLTVKLMTEPLFVQGDPVRLTQIAVNIVNNAAKYTPPGGDIEISAARERGEAVLRVRDNGMGLSAEMMPRIFDLFAQSDAQVRLSEGGLGIGLALVRRLVELHGGSIEAYSEGVGRGSEFIVRLPLGDEPAAPEPSAEEAMAETVGAPRALVIDDDHDVADSFCLLLENLGARVRTAYDGASGAAMIEKFEPHLIFVDIGMPGLDGYETARRIRRTNPAETFILVALTGWGQEDVRQRAREAGFDLHLTKPAPIAAIQELLCNARSSSSPMAELWR